VGHLALTSDNCCIDAVVRAVIDRCQVLSAVGQGGKLDNWKSEKLPTLTTALWSPDCQDFRFSLTPDTSEILPIEFGRVGLWAVIF
jgi:hypothetical protein